MKIKLKFINHLVVLFFLLSLGLNFQNCSGQKSFLFEDSSREQLLDSMGYRYSEKTPIYFEINVRPTAIESNFRDLIVVASAAPADGSKAVIDYKIEMLNQEGLAVCSSYSGKFESGVTLLEKSDSCPSSSKVYQVRYQITYQGVSYEQIKTFGSNGI